MGVVDESVDEESEVLIRERWTGGLGREKVEETGGFEEDCDGGLG